ncbi:hypothetical protein ACFP81_10780 [Deinococcus lacus]|uniref:Uncharacterized protein n=1 Tax=Deinococcus lacus TaxID=392561 RepID=A0ABW1YG68_9DEIO
MKLTRAFFALVALAASVYTVSGSSANAYLTGCEIAAKGCP